MQQQLPQRGFECRSSLISVAFSAGLFVIIFNYAIGTRSFAEQADPIVTRMAHVNVFAFGGVGFAGVMSEGETDFKSLLARPTASADFERVFAIGNLEAKAYALVAMHSLNPKKFKALSDSLRIQNEKVIIMQGCILSSKAMNLIVIAIESGTYQ